jgi:RimJ/RimL family protein N-acetyltransferase
MTTTLTTARLRLRRLTADDAADVHAYRSLPEVTRFQCWAPASVDEVREFIAALSETVPAPPGRWFQFGIGERESGALVGDLGLRTRVRDARQLELGITIAPAHQGRGYATEAVRAALDHAFGRLGMHRVHGSVDPDNRPSRALLERVGMRQEAHLVEALPFKGGWADDVIYAMLAREWRGTGASES